MLGSIGAPEFIFILLIALLIFGPRKLPEIGRTLGKGLGEFRRATNELKRTLDAEMIEEELRKSDPRRILKEDSGKKPPPARPDTTATGPNNEAATPSATAAADGGDQPSSEPAGGAEQPEQLLAVDRTVARGQLDPTQNFAEASNSPAPEVDTEDGAAKFSPQPAPSGGKDQ